MRERSLDAGLALQLARWGVQPGELAWLDAPPAAAFAQGCDLLARLGALDARGALTAHGQAMAELPAHPRIAHLLLSGVFTGIFIGKFLRYARARSQQARAA